MITAEAMCNDTVSFVDSIIVFFMRGWDPAIQCRRYARLYFGLNVIGQEAAVPEGIHSIPIPFMKHDHGLIRFKKFKCGESYGGYKIRCDQEIERIKNKMAYYSCDRHFKHFAEVVLEELKYIAEGPYDSGRNS